MSRLTKTIYEEFKEKPESVELWSDSKIVLHWLRSETSPMKAFVGVRVTEIQSTRDQQNWKYVSTDLNPADDLSRGLSTEEPRQMNYRSCIPQKAQITTAKGDTRHTNGKWPRNEEFKTQTYRSCCPNRRSPRSSHIFGLAKTSESYRLLYALILSNARKRTKHQTSSVDPRDGPLMPAEIEQALHYWDISAQRQLGDWESRFEELAPFIREGVVRVG